MDDPPPPYEEAIAPANEGRHHPENAPGVATNSTDAAGPRIYLLEGGTLQLKAALSQDAKASLKAVLVEVKVRILPRNAVTDEEVQQFIDMIYEDGWKPGQFVEPGDEKSTNRTGKNSTFTIGVLVESLEASPRSIGRGRPRSFSERRVHRATAPRADVWWRQAGAPVRLLVEHKQNGVISFSLRDTKFAIIQTDAKVNYDVSKTEAYFQTMRKNDDFMVKNAHAYNIEQAIYICRNRLTYWSNPGVRVGQLPPLEKLGDALSDLMFCRYSVSFHKSPFFAYLMMLILDVWQANIIKCPADAITRLRATPAPKLFRWFEQSTAVW